MLIPQLALKQSQFEATQQFTAVFETAYDSEQHSVHPFTEI